MNRKPEIITCNDIKDVAAKAAEIFVNIANSVISKRGIFRVALSGGSTPRYLYYLLSTNELIHWDKVHLFWGDERCVSPDDVMSNYWMTSETLIRKLNLPQENIHRIKGEMGEKAAVEYEDDIRKAFETEDGASPEFDLMLLGMGEDGHTASIFPGTHAVKEYKKIAAIITEDKVKIPRITLTPLVINNALNIIFLVAGRNKSSVLKEVIEGDFEPERFPAQITRYSKGRVRWFVDEEAAVELTGTYPMSKSLGYLEK